MRRTREGFITITCLPFKPFPTPFPSTNVLFDVFLVNLGVGVCRVDVTVMISIRTAIASRAGGWRWVGSIVPSLQQDMCQPSIEEKKKKKEKTVINGRTNATYRSRPWIPAQCMRFICPCRWISWFVDRKSKLIYIHDSEWENEMKRPCSEFMNRDETRTHRPKQCVEEGVEHHQVECFVMNLTTRNNNGERTTFWEKGGGNLETLG